MCNFTFKLTSELKEEAREFENFRLLCKEYLKATGNDHDKFTIVSHDSYIGFISEIYIREYIKWKYENEGFYSRSWSDNFDMAEIQRIINERDYSPESSRLINDYFYDPYDLEIIKGSNRIFVDVKTALTRLNPTDKWDFMYPMIQANKSGKDYMILAYFITADGNAYGNLKQIEIIGFIDESTIKKCNIIWKGMYTKFGTKSQTNNFETNLSRDYRPIAELFEYFDDLSHK